LRRSSNEPSNRSAPVEQAGAPRANQGQSRAGYRRLGDLLERPGLLFEKYRIAGYLFLREEVLPRSRADFRLPQVYQVDLDNYGVDYTPAELERLAHQTFTEVQEQMRPIAERTARQRKLSSTDYRDVIRAMKKEQIPGDQILPI